MERIGKCKFQEVVLVHRDPSWAGKPNVYGCSCGQPDCPGYQEYSTTRCILTGLRCVDERDCKHFKAGKPRIVTVRH